MSSPASLRSRGGRRPRSGPFVDRYPHVPVPASDRRAWILACSVGAVGLLVLVAVLSGLVGRTSAVAPPAIVLRAATPAPAAVGAAYSGSQAAAADAIASDVADESRPAGAPAASHRKASAAAAARPAAALLAGTASHISRRWMEGFYPIYATAQSTFGVNWLLIASIHMQETAFSTAPSTYHGLNFAHCCGGPMQFNVRNGRVTTWDLVSNSYIYGRRPAAYDHMTARHPSIYDDFDAIMAGAHLLSADGAGSPLDYSAWVAAYDYYGHDLFGVLYADTVLARAIGWSQHGFCAGCGVESRLVDAVDAAYGAPVRAALEAQSRPRAQATAARVRRSARRR